MYRTSLKKIILAVIDDIKFIVKSTYNEKFWIDWYGAYDIDPKNLVIWICVESDEIKSELCSDDKLMSQLRSTLVKYGYPEEAIPLVHIGVESQETVNRESDGSWYDHFK